MDVRIANAISCLPKTLKEYFVHSLTDIAANNEITAHVTVNSVNEHIDKIMCILSRASTVTNLDIASLFEAVDFGANDLESGRFSSMFAELRIINQLDILGFCDITPLKRCEGSKRPDIIAVLQDVDFAIEVFNKSIDKTIYRSTNLPRVKNLNHNGLVEYLKLRLYPQKLLQVGEYLRSGLVDRAIIVAVIDADSSLACTDSAAMQRVVQEVRTDLDCPDRVQVAIFTGTAEDGWVIAPTE